MQNDKPLPAPVALPQAVEVEEDAYGRTGEREDCMSCGGTGTEYGETCLTCGGYGWVNNPPTPTETPTAAAPDDGLMGRYREAETLLAEACSSGEFPHESATIIRGTEWVRKSAAVRAIRKALSTATGDEAQQGEG